MKADACAVNPAGSVDRPHADASGAVAHKAREKYDRGMCASRRLPTATRLLSVALGLVGCAGQNAATPTPPPLPAAAVIAAPTKEPDPQCLRELREQQVPFLLAASTRGIRTPVQITGDIHGLRLTPRAGRPPLMDCELARALAEAAPIFHSVGLTQLFFSGAYDYRTRRESAQLSAHAFGLAIDVHTLSGTAGVFSIKRDFPAGSGRWRGLSVREGDLDGCVGHPSTADARRLRTLACQLKHHSAFRVVLTPDDNADHRDHLHLEAFPDADMRVARVLGRYP